MEKEELQEILKLHKMWLNHEPGGECADLSSADLHEADLCNADLRYAIMRNANLHGAIMHNCSLRYANLRDADLSGAIMCCADLHAADLQGVIMHNSDLHDADLSGAIMFDADLRNANLSGAIMCKADLRAADLSGAIMCRSDLRSADLSGSSLQGANFYDANLFAANLRGAKYLDTAKVPYTHFFALQCPEKGAYTAYKKVGEFVIELEIPADALRSSATTRQCRASKAKVISITYPDGSPANTESVNSDYGEDSTFSFVVGQMVEDHNFCEDRWERVTGIHHFITRQEAVLYQV